MFLPYASSAFVPVSTMPSWLRGFADHQPITVVVETLRGRLLDLPDAGSVPLAALWCGGILLASILLSSVLFRLRTK
jgi:ABC-2 type transport system permease protein